MAEAGHSHRTSMPNSVQAGRKNEASSDIFTNSQKSGSHKSGRSSLASQKRATAEAARVRLEYVKKEAEMLKKLAALEEEQRFKEAETVRARAEYDVEINLLREEKEVAAACAEAAYLELQEDDFLRELPIQCSRERAQEYVDSLAPKQEPVESKPLCALDKNVKFTDFVPNAETHKTFNMCQEPQINVQAETTDILTTFLLRKDIMPKRLQRFNEKPQMYAVWKATFKTIMQELRATPIEELDLLVNHLGSESQKWAESLRASNTINPERGLALIWERLEMVYGSPENIEASLKARLDSFQSITNKDNKRLYDLCDLLLELESVKADPRFATQFSIYDSSTGVNKVVEKLPYGIQQKWISHAFKYKQEHCVTFPPFSVFVEFVKTLSHVRNDPAFQFEATNVSKPSKDKGHVGPARVVNRKTQVSDSKDAEQGEESSAPTRCPIHKAEHSLSECKAFARKTWNERHDFLKEKGICFRCLATSHHIASKCPVPINCERCGRKGHLSVMHRDYPQMLSKDTSVNQHDGVDQVPTNVTSKCTTLCGSGFQGRSCGKIVLVDIHCDQNPNKTEKVYAILDDQSNRSLISPELCDRFGLSGHALTYTLSSCSGSTVMAGRYVSGLTVCSLDGKSHFKLPTLIECDAIPQEIGEIPTPQVAYNFSHLEQIASYIPQLEADCGIHLLLGRDLPVVHHVLNQITGQSEQPFALQLPLGWVIIGEVCLGKVHKPDSVSTYYTVLDNGLRSSIFKPCELNLHVKENQRDNDLFQLSPMDNKVGLSAEDRDFLKQMDSEFAMDPSGQWTAPLPFKSSRPVLPDNQAQAFQRAIGFNKDLNRKPLKCKHMVAFMESIFNSNAAEKAPVIADGKERWYLPLFGVYHPKKPGQIRGVFDSSIVFKGTSLNDCLLSGPNLTNNLLGVLLRFRRDKYAVCADIEQMFYRFLVNTEDRDFLRFYWFQDNNPKLPLTTYRMRVHVFGNRPSPAVATYGLRRAVANAEEDIQRFVCRDFYVDDGLTSVPGKEDAISLLKRTQETLQSQGKIRLHKIASNDVDIMNHFPKEDLGKSLKDLDLYDELPAQQSLGLTWDINLDMFTFNAPDTDRPLTKRGMLSALNSLFDPIGFVAPLTISGKILLREACPDNAAWDDQLSQSKRATVKPA